MIFIIDTWFRVTVLFSSWLSFQRLFFCLLTWSLNTTSCLWALYPRSLSPPTLANQIHPSHLCTEYIACQMHCSIKLIVCSPVWTWLVGTSAWTNLSWTVNFGSVYLFLAVFVNLYLPLVTIFCLSLCFGPLMFLDFGLRILELWFWIICIFAPTVFLERRLPTFFQDFCTGD